MLHRFPCPASTSPVRHSASWCRRTDESTGGPPCAALEEDVRRATSDAKDSAAASSTSFSRASSSDSSAVAKVDLLLEAAVRSLALPPWRAGVCSADPRRSRRPACTELSSFGRAPSRRAASLQGLKYMATCRRRATSSLCRIAKALKAPKHPNPDSEGSLALGGSIAICWMRRETPDDAPAAQPSPPDRASASTVAALNSSSGLLSSAETSSSSETMGSVASPSRPCSR
mmetsp:Transcript_20907/g.49863  ORF Transcript_20907/g.49863 Transcript_20907/m.49863 type:complete len:230 (-) Transcript_20907:1197-1886(-)